MVCTHNETQITVLTKAEQAATCTAALQEGERAMIHFVQTYLQPARYQKVMDYSSQRIAKDCEKTNNMTIL